MRFGHFLISRRFGTGVRHPRPLRAAHVSQRTARHSEGALRDLHPPVLSNRLHHQPSTLLPPRLAVPFDRCTRTSRLQPSGVRSRASRSRAVALVRRAARAKKKRSRSGSDVRRLERFHPPTTPSAPSPRARPHPTHRRRRRRARRPRRRCRPWTPARFDRWRSTPPRCSS